MNKKKLVVAIAYTMYASVNQFAYAANDIEIVSGSTQVNIAGSPSYASTDDSAQLGISNITSIWNASIISEPVTLSTSTLGANNQSGDITFTEDLSYAGSTMSVLNLNAHNDIHLNGTISGNYEYNGYNSDYGFNNGLVLNLNPDSDTLNGGVVNLNGSISGNVHTTVNGALEIGATGTYSLDNHFNAASLTAGSINVAAGGSFDYTHGHLTLTDSDITIGTDGLLGDTFSMGSSGISNAGKWLTLANDGVLTIDAGASFTMDGYRLEVGSIINNGTFSFTDGSLTLTNSGLTIGADGLLGDTFLLNSRDLTLANNNVLTIDAGATFTMLYGDLEVGSIVNNGSFNFNEGSLTLTNSGLTIGTDGLLGDNVDLSGWRTMSISGDVSVEDGATLSVDNRNYSYGQVDNHFLGNLNNQGTVAINNTQNQNQNSSVLTVDGVITNDGASASLTLDGGTLFAGSITNINDGSVNFNSGSLNLTNSGLTVGNTGVLGDDVALSTTRSLSAVGDIAIDSGATLSLNSGTLSAGSITNNGSFNFNAGRLELTNSGLTVGAAGLLGNDVTATWARSLSIAGDVTIDAGATLTADSEFAGGSVYTSHFLSNLNNQGTVSISNSGNSSYGGGLIVDGAINNDGAGASLTLDDGRLTAGSINNINGGSFSFNSGRLELTNSGLTVGVGGLLGENVALSNTRWLTIAHDVMVDNGATLSVSGQGGSSNTTHFLSDLNNSGTVTVNDSLGWRGRLTVDGTVTNDGAGASLTIDNGSIVEVGAINNINGGSINFISGDLELTKSALTVGAGGLLGDTVTLLNDRRLFLTSDNLAEATLTVDAGASLTLDGGTLTVADISNHGNFSFNSGRLALSQADLIIGSGGLLGDAHTLALGDSLSLNNGVLTVDAGASFTMDGGTLSVNGLNNNGSFNFNSGSLYSNGDFNIGGGDIFTLGNGSRMVLNNAGLLTVNSGASLDLSGGRLEAGSISNNGNFTFNSGTLELTNSNITIGSAGFLGDTVVLGADQSLWLTSGLGELTVDAGASFTLDGGYLSVASVTDNGSFTYNSGSLELTNSALTIGVDGLIGDAVSLVSGDYLSVHNEMLTVDAGASLSLDGGYLNADIGNNGNFSFNSGQLHLQNSLTVGDGGLLGSNVALSSNRELHVSRSMTIDSGARLSVSGGSSSASAGSALYNNGTVAVSGGELFVHSGITNTGTIAVSGGRLNSNYGGIDNSGTVNLTNTGVINSGTYTQSAGRTNIASGTTMNVNYYGSSTYTQDAGTTTVNGELNAQSVVINAGQLRGAGMINGSVTVNGGQINPGNSPGTLEITGDFVLTEAGTLHMEVGSDGLDPAGYLYDQLIVGGDYDLQGGLLKFSLLDGIGIADFESDFVIGDFFRHGTSGSDTTFNLLQLSMFNNLDLYAYDVLGESWFSLALDGSTGGFIATASVAPVPVPAAVWLFGSGLIGLFGVARRKAA